MNLPETKQINSGSVLFKPRASTIIIPEDLDFFPLKRAVEKWRINRFLLCCRWAAIVLIYRLSTKGEEHRYWEYSDFVLLVCPTYLWVQVPIYCWAQTEITSSLVFLQDNILQSFREVSSQWKGPKHCHTQALSSKLFRPSLPFMERDDHMFERENSKSVKSTLALALVIMVAESSKPIHKTHAAEWEIKSFLCVCEGIDILNLQNYLGNLMLVCYGLNDTSVVEAWCPDNGILH